MNDKLKQLLIRCYSNETMLKGDEAQGIMSDEQAIKELCNETFSNGVVTTEKLEKFNAVLFETADVVAQPKIDKIMNFISDFKKLDAGVTMREITIPEECKLAFQFTAVGSQPDFKRVEAGSKIYSTPKYAQIGIYYEPMSKTERAVEDYRKAVNDIANAKVRLYVKESMEVIRQAIADGKIPAGQVLDGTSLTLKEFKKAAQRVSRRAGNGQVTFLADPALIDYFAMQQTNTADYALPEEFKESLAKIHATKVMDVNCVNLINPYKSTSGTATTEYPVNEGYLLGASGDKPLVITEFGGLEKQGMIEVIDGRVKTMARIGLDITLLHGEAMGKVTEDSVTL